MHPQILRTLPLGRQALSIRDHNLFRIAGKEICFHKISPIMMLKRIATRFLRYCLFARVGDKMTKTGTADRMKCASRIYF